ncbi:MAG: DUF1624 domain-containing protein [Lachnospiraceae bacterium]|nr:DUF1624 domain-containing protein [Lachnospiraceae bacterium]
MNSGSKRLHLLDAYRGFVVLVMIAYHFCYDLFVIFKGQNSWIYDPRVFAWEQYICISFIFLSGFVWNLSNKKSFKRGLIVSLLGILVTFVTFIFDPSIAIYYGVLFLIGASMLFMVPLSKILDRFPPLPVFLLSLLLFFITYSIPSGYLGFYRLRLFKLPDCLYNHKLLIPFGFPTPDFTSSDYFPLIPWLFLYISGYGFCRLLQTTGVLYREKFLKCVSTRIPFLDFIGKHSLTFYILHQPLCYVLLLAAYNYSSS